MLPVHLAKGLAGTDPSPLEPAGPLWQRVPTRDENGAPLADFMMLVPRLKQRSSEQQRDVLARINRVLLSYQSSVVFAELNLRTNLLWVSIRPRLGLCLELPAAIHALVPEALLVGPYWR